MNALRIKQGWMTIFAGVVMTGLLAGTTGAAILYQDDFSGGTLAGWTSTPTDSTEYCIVDLGGGNNGMLLYANVDTPAPYISASFGATQANTPVTASLTLGNSESNFDGHAFSMSFFDSSSGKGYTVSGANANSWGSPVSGFGWGTYHTILAGGVANEKLWGAWFQSNALVFTFDPATQHLTLTRNGTTVIDATYGGQTLTTVDRFDVMVSNSGGTQNRFVDDVVITGTPVPEPHCLALLGLAGLALWRGRREKGME